ncbi:MAG: hypothetical protein QOH65_3308 [Methylobacteriaceae bacterium]|nr:hypothetical protein [Methylobacteriaceae bacterium]
MRDCPAERRRARPLRIDMNVLIIERDLGESIDELLVDGTPGREPDLAADSSLKLGDA